MRRSLRLAVLLASIPALHSCVNPAHQAAQTEEIVLMGQTLNNLQFLITDLETRIDSLVGVIAKQDTSITRIADFTGLVLPGRGGQ